MPTTNVSDINTVPDAAFLVSADGKIKAFNQQAIEMFGYNYDEMMGQPIELLVPDDTKGKHVELRNHWFSQPAVRPFDQAINIRGRCKSGKTFRANIMLAPVNDGEMALAFVRDITAMETLLKKAQAIALKLKTIESNLE